jgi:hypothetical protein
MTAAPRIVKIVFRIVNLQCSSASLARQKASRCASVSLDITIGDANVYISAIHETGSKFVGQKIFRLNIRHDQADYSRAHQRLETNNIMDFFSPIRFNRRRTAWLSERNWLGERNDEKAFDGASLGLVARLGANEIGTQKRDRPSRQLRADRPDGGWKTGLFDEVRELAGTAAAPGATGRNRAGTRAGAGSAAQRNFRSVL